MAEKTPHGGTDTLITHPPFRERVAPTVMDEVTLAFRQYKSRGGEMSVPDWHDSDLCPVHRRCSLCD